jgi:hypothetical protein
MADWVASKEKYMYGACRILGMIDVMVFVTMEVFHYLYLCDKYEVL